jgi:SAM-dependent methyltransferase
VRLNLGCGSLAQPGWVNVDTVKQDGVDVVHDLDEFPWPFGDMEADHIRAFDVYEHVNDPLGFMAECHRVLQPGGALFIHTAYWKNECSFTDPTHKRFLTEKSFDYWIPGTDYNRRYGAAYARGCHFQLADLHLDIPGVGDLNVTLRRI